MAVTALTAPENRYHGYQKIVASTKCPKPHARMKTANSKKTGANEPVFLRKMNYSNISGIAVYEAKIATSETICTQP